jgi:hypothetical protein
MRKTQFFGRTNFLAAAIALFILLGCSPKQVQPPTLISQKPESSTQMILLLRVLYFHE